MVRIISFSAPDIKKIQGFKFLRLSVFFSNDFYFFRYWKEKPLIQNLFSADKKLLVAENMELTEAEAKDFWPVYNQYQDELFLLRTRTVKLIKDFAEAYEKMSNETAKKLMDEFITIESLGPKLRQAYLPKFRKVLPEAKVVRYYQIENKIQAALFYELAANIPLMKAAK